MNGASTAAVEPETSRAAPTERSGPTDQGETTEPRPRSARRRVLILGDSMAATDFGRALEARLDAEAHVDARRRGKSATGLARPDFFDWMEEGLAQAERHDPDLVVVILGGNDGQDLIEPANRRGRVHWNGPQWEAAYAQRVRRFAEALTAPAHRRLLWIELPLMDRAGLERKLTIIRRIQAEVLRTTERSEYLATRGWFLDEQGALKSQVRLRGREHPMRQKDGIHFSLPGAEWFAELVSTEVLARLELPERAGPVSPNGAPTKRASPTRRETRARRPG